MSSKDQVYDPALDYYTDSDSDLSDTEYGDHSSPILWSEGKCSRQAEAGYHLGGPQADNEGRKLAASPLKQKIGDCKMFVGQKKCNKKNVPLYKGNCYPCHGGTQEHRDQHNSLCYDCATGRNESLSDDVLDCFVHLGTQAVEDEDDPEPLMEA